MTMASQIPKSLGYRIGEAIGALGALAVIACGVIGVLLLAFKFDDPELHRRGVGLALIALLARGRR